MVDFFFKVTEMNKDPNSNIVRINKHIIDLKITYRNF